MTEDGTLNEAWGRVHREFHEVLNAGSGNARLQAVAASLRDSMELYRRWYWVLTDDTRATSPLSTAGSRTSPSPATPTLRSTCWCVTSNVLRTR